MSTGRLEAFSDGVLAVIITILVLELKVEAGGPGLAEQLSEQWPVFLAYLVSFAVVGVIWIQHHALFRLAERVDKTVLVWNLVLLLAASLLPFAAKAVGGFVAGELADAHLAILLYGACMELMAIAFTVILWRLLSAGLTHVAVPVEGIRPAVLRFGVGTVIYPVIVAIGFVSPVAALVGFGVVVLAYLAERTPIREQQP